MKKWLIIGLMGWTAWIDTSRHVYDMDIPEEHRYSVQASTFTKSQAVAPTPATPPDQKGTNNEQHISRK